MITSDKLAAVILGFRAMCLSRYTGDIDPLNQQERAERLGQVLSEPNDYLQARFSQPIDRLCLLIKTPRLVKTILRQVHQSWRKLHGEIDFDDLLVATAIKFTAPEAFDFIIENFRMIRALQHQGIGSEKKERTEQIEARWGQLKDLTWDHATVGQLIGFLFPMWILPSFHSGWSKVAQGVSISEPTDYWMRLQIGDLTRGEIRDQETIQAILKWANGQHGPHFRDTGLPEALTVRADFSKKFEQFASAFLTGQQLRQLASSMFAIVLRRDGVTANDDSAAGFKHLWRCAIRQPIDLADHVQWIKEEILRCLGQSLRFANELFYWWGINAEIEVDTAKDRQALLRDVAAGAKELYIGNPEKFIEVIDPAFIPTCYHFAALNSSPKQGGPGFKPEEWRWFANLLLSACHIDPETIIPQIAPFMVKETMKAGRGFVPEFSEQDGLQFFGDKFDEAVRLIRREIDLSRFSEQGKQQILTVQHAARALSLPGENT